MEIDLDPEHIKNKIEALLAISEARDLDFQYDKKVFDIKILLLECHIAISALLSEIGDDKDKTVH